jgi:hypothetical protein
LAYQVPEIKDGACGRSFEAAFMLANPKLFGIAQEDQWAIEDAVWKKAEEVSSKVQFALKYATEEHQWNVPRYIAEGLQWLAGPPVSGVQIPTPPEEHPDLGAEVAEELVHA